MAINHADGTIIFTSLLACPAAGGIAAARAGAGSFTLLFIPAGLAVGIGVSYVGRKLVYAITEFGLNRASKAPKSWIQHVLFAPFFILYMILPVAIAWGGVFSIWEGTIWLVKHAL